MSQTSDCLVAVTLFHKDRQMERQLWG